MKKIAMLLILALCLMGVAFAEAQPAAPADPKTVTTPADVVGVELTFERYDSKYYDVPCATPGTVERIDYTTDAYGESQDAWANVCLPAGYDEGTKYNVIYFLHGTNENQDSFIGEERARNGLDNMIAHGDVEPFILVCPTYYYDYENRAIDIIAFVSEVRDDLMPAVEGKYSTFAETADEAGFVASRDHRAFAGFSRGCYATWHMFFHNLDVARWYMPFSANISGADEMGLEMPVEEQMQLLHDAIDAQADYKDSFYIYATCGGKRDMMYDVNNALMSAMIADTDYFSFGTDTTANNLCYALSSEVHQTLMARLYFYNALKVVFH